MNASAVQSVLKEKMDQLTKLDVEHLWLFGSAARGESIVQDLDFLVTFKTPPRLENFMGLKFALEAWFEMPVDLHTRNSCPERFFKRIELDLQHVA